MKKIVFSIIVFACFIALMASMMLPISAIPTDTEPVEYDSTEAEQLDVTDSYYYDRITDRQKWCYNYLKEYADNFTGETGQHRYDWTNLLPAGSTDEDYYQLMADMCVAQMALWTDHPMYTLKLGNFGYGCDTTDPQNVRFTVDIDHPHILTDDVEAQANARIEQIVNTVGGGDRYTKLYKLTDYLLTNTFYDPYLDQIEVGTGCYEELLNRFPDDIRDRVVAYDASAYGVLLANIAICDGYADVVKVLCNELDIPCIIMGNNGHAWNLVQMEDGKWYRLDITNACRLGWDGVLPQTLDEYFSNIFLKNDTLLNMLGTYDNPCMVGVTDFPEHAEGQYEYTGTTTDFFYEIVPSTYTTPAQKFYYQVHRDGKTCRITNFEGKIDGDLVIPESIDGYTVTVIAPFVFYYRTDIMGKVIIPDTVVEIGYAAFAGCYNMTSVELPESLQELGKGAFIGCKSLTEIDLPDLLESVSEYTFYDCDSLTKVSFGTHIQFVEQNAFDRIDSTLLIQAPDGSVAHTLAQTKEIAFEEKGTLCPLVDADSEWEFYDFGHFHTCEHGARFDLQAHVKEFPIYTCGDMCVICEAHLCNTYGYIRNHSIYEWKQYENYPEVWGNTVGHYKECLCGKEFDTGAHHGGTATEEQRAICEECGAEYGELVHVHRNFIWLSGGEEGHYKVCADCGESMNETEPHRGGTATEEMRAQCEVCGEYYGDVLPHTTHVCSYWVYASEEIHYQVCEKCYVQFNEGPHQGGVATETQRAICELCDGAYGDYAPHVSISTGSDEYGHFDVCACGEKLNFEAHYGGTATDDELPICVVCGVAYGHIHTPIVNGCDEYGHYQICDCGEMLNFEAHYGGTATEDQLALCEACGVAYGDFAVHIHNGENGFVSEENGHFKICTCGETFDFEPHYGGVATEYELALCEACGVAYGDFAEHVHAAIDIGYYEDKHFNICSCGLWMDEESHYGGTATTTQRARCVVCGVEYGDFAIDSPENNTEAPENNTEPPENNTEAPENNTEPPENNTEAPENNTEKIENNTGGPDSNIKEPDSNNSAINAGLAGGCDSSVGVGLISLVTSLAAGYVILKKKKEN